MKARAIHQTLRVTPAMEAKLSAHPWTIEDLIALLPKATVTASTIENEMLARALGVKTTV